MRKFAILASLAAGVSLVFVTLVPQPADAGWRRKAWRNGYYSTGYAGRRFVSPGLHAYVRPRAGYYVPRNCRRGRQRCGTYPYAHYPYWRQRSWGGWY